MSRTQSPQNDERDRLRVMITDYENRLSDTAKLVAAVRHETNNALAALFGQVQLLLRQDLSEKSRRRAEMIESLAKRIQEIVARSGIKS